MPHLNIKDIQVPAGREAFSDSYPAPGLYRVSSGLALVYTYQIGMPACVMLLPGCGGLTVEDDPAAGAPQAGIDVHRLLDQLIQIRA